MNTFKKLFSVTKDDIREDVVITPFLNLEYFLRNKGSKISKGFLFEVLCEKYFSVVRVGVNSAFVGDCVVYLKETACKRLYFIGSCGVISDFKIGDLLLVNKALAWESFSEILGRNPSHFFINAENDLLNRFSDSHKDIKKANLATLGSLSLQERVVPSLKKQEIDVVDMEVSSFLSATKYLRLQSLALLYATDIISRKPFFRDLDNKERVAIKSSRQRAISLICDFIQKINA
jgi:purine-nucleoside phosphorylase